MPTNVSKNDKMAKSNQNGPTFEAPTEWRRIVMEENEDGLLRPAKVESVSAQESVVGSHVPASRVPSDMPQEWQDILHAPEQRALAISLEHDLDPAEQTIPGMRIPPQLYDDEMVSLETNTGYSIHGQDFSTPEATTVGLAPQAPPNYQDFPFSQEPEDVPARVPNLVVPQPQGETFAPPPVEVFPGSKLGAPPGGEPYTPPDTALHQQPEDELPIATAEIDIPPEPVMPPPAGYHSYEEPEASPDRESTNELDAELAPGAESADYHLEASDLEYTDESEFQEAYQRAEDTGAFDSVPDAPQADASPAAGVTSEQWEHMSTMLHEMIMMQQETIEQFDVMQEQISKQADTLTQTQQQLGEVVKEVSTQAKDNKQTQDLIQELSDDLAVDRADRHFEALHSVFQDLLLLYDFIDLRLRSLWGQKGKEHPTSAELSTIRDRLIETLERQHLYVIEIADPLFDPASQRALQEVETDDPDEDGKISRIFRQGFRYKERVFRPSEIEVKRYSGESSV